MKKDKSKYQKIIERELKIWKMAYPKEAKVLEKFANKIKFELELT